MVEFDLHFSLFENNNKKIKADQKPESKLQTYLDQYSLKSNQSRSNSIVPPIGSGR